MYVFINISSRLKQFIAEIKSLIIQLNEFSDVIKAVSLLIAELRICEISEGFVFLIQSPPSFSDPFRLNPPGFDGMSHEYQTPRNGKKERLKLETKTWNRKLNWILGRPKRRSNLFLLLSIFILYFWEMYLKNHPDEKHFISVRFTRANRSISSMLEIRMNGCKWNTWWPPASSSLSAQLLPSNVTKVQTHFCLSFAPVRQPGEIGIITAKLASQRASQPLTLHGRFQVTQHLLDMSESKETWTGKTGAVCVYIILCLWPPYLICLTAKYLKNLIDQVCSWLNVESMQ